METSTSSLIAIIGAIVGLILIFLNVKASRSLAGSFFKNYYRWMIAGAVIFFLGFVAELPIFNISRDIADSLHHLFLIVAGLIFVVTSVLLHKDAAKYVCDKTKEQK